MPVPEIIAAGQPLAADPALVGNKFARLETMRRASMRIPPWFSLPASWFDHALALASPDPGPRGTDDEKVAWCARAASALRGLPFPEAWAASILAAFDSVFAGDTLVAVRASVVGASADASEDGARDAFAGMSDSFLYVPRKDLLERIAACWASAFTARGVEYRRRQGIDPSRARVAVGVQEMIDGARSFVAFTRDPVTSERRTVIAAAHGIAEGVVQGSVDVDHFFVRGPEVTSTVIHKARMAVRADGASHESTRISEVPAERATAPVLTDHEARQIADTAAKIEDLFRAPQDIEGTISRDGLVHIVQARPITVLDDTSGRTYWGNHNITESYPGISCALTYSQATEFYRRAFGDLYHRFGVPPERIDGQKHELERLVGYLNGRIYYRLDAWHALHSQLPAFDFLRAAWEQSMGIHGDARRPAQWSKARAFASLPVLLARLTRHPSEVREFLRWWDEWLTDAGDLSTLTPSELVSFYRRMWAQVSVRWGVTLTNSFYALFALGALKAALGPSGTTLMMGALVGSGELNRSTQAVLAAIDLAERVAANPELKEAVVGESARADSEVVWRDLCAGRYGASVLAAFREYVQRFGDRGMHDLKLEEATARQKPWLVIDAIRPYVHQGRTVARLKADLERGAREADEELKKAIPSRPRRAAVRLLARWGRWHGRAREDTRFCRTQLYGLSREVMWRLGRELARTGQLDDWADVRDLTVDEVLGAFDGTLPGSALRPLAAARRAEREGYASTSQPEPLIATPKDVPMAMALSLSTPLVPETRRADDASVLRGLGSCKGVVRARAKVVLDTSVSPETCQGTILVARETDPGWLSLMMAAKGIIVERGTPLSHTAITGRQLGIPTVVAVPDATTLIADGATIELDGGAGTVRILQGGASG